MEKKIKSGLLAYGMSGKVFHAPFISTHPGFELVAVTERNHKKAAADYPGIISYDSVEETINSNDLDLIVINTPNFTHYDYAKKALEAGKHILVEKPFTTTVAEAKELYELAESLNKKIFVFQSRRFDSDFIAVRKVIESGILGRLHEIHFHYDRYRSTISPKTFKEDPMPASGLQYDLGPHLLDQVISMFGKPDSFYKVLGKNRASTKVDDYFSIHLTYPNSLSVFVHANMLITDIQPSFIVYGHDGSLIKERADIQEEQLLKGLKPTDSGYGIEPIGKEGAQTLIDLEGNKTKTFILSEKGDYTVLFEALYQTLVNGIEFPVKKEEILIQLEILEKE
jgi:scyllo-inositol 2-dehydrogenase (NADP+)